MKPRGTRTRLVLTLGTAAALIGCLVAVWALPRPVAASATGPAPQQTATTTAAAAGSPCDLIVGPARDYCAPAGLEATGPAALTGRVPSRAQGLWLVGFSTAALTAAIGLIVTASGRAR
ncbi:hypothetical protein ABZ883_35360 [Streptomyces sp. NPDC046977]|uniref:hypothetical protein n=1 Tax=Streptomyces sp. NPDC046977 TaxID=3154703 RepID=UPI0033DD7435